MMVAEIIAGIAFNSMALLSDGLHMSTHTVALAISFIAYFFSRRQYNNKQYAFGTWKIEILGAYTSAILLGIVGLYVIYLSVERVVNPVMISYDSALIVAFIGLAVNAICAIILNTGDHQHTHSEHHEDHHHEHEEHHTDLNLKSAYLHVIADALTSVFAILALFGAKYFGWNWLDPVIGIVSAILIFRWAFLLLKDTGSILLDKEMQPDIIKEIRDIMESDNDTKISDIHIWRVAEEKYACILALVAKNPLPLDVYKQRLADVHELAHITIEIDYCKDNPMK